MASKTLTMALRGRVSTEEAEFNKVNDVEYTDAPKGEEGEHIADSGEETQDLILDAELKHIATEMEQVEEAIDQASEDVAFIERTEDVINSRQPQGLTQVEAQLATEALQHIFSRNGVKVPTPSCENFSGIAGNRAHETRLLLVSTEEAKTSIGEKIKKAWEWFVAKVKEFFAKIFSRTESLSKKAKEILDTKPGKDYEKYRDSYKEGKYTDNVGFSLIDDKKVGSVSDIIKQAEELKGHLNQYLDNSSKQIAASERAAKIFTSFKDRKEAFEESEAFFLETQSLFEKTGKALSKDELTSMEGDFTEGRRFDTLGGYGYIVFGKQTISKGFVKYESPDDVAVGLAKAQEADKLLEITTSILTALSEGEKVVKQVEKVSGWIKYDKEHGFFIPSILAVMRVIMTEPFITLSTNYLSKASAVIEYAKISKALDGAGKSKEDPKSLENKA